MNTNLSFQQPLTLDNCDREPIHIPGLIQPHGFLLVVSVPDWKIVQVSANTSEHLSITPEQLPGKSITGILGEAFAHTLTTFLASERSGFSVRREIKQVDLALGKYHAIIHPHPHFWILEFEALADEAEIDFSYLNGMLSHLQQAGTLIEFCHTAASQIRLLTGFDRVMVYRFDEAYNGEVIAEARREDLEPFLGLHYPATDIPKQARELYEKNWIRYIRDVQYTSVPLVPVENPLTKQPLDMSFAVLRSVSPIHIEYLKNMGVGASMSISILKEGKLWGLFACHHYGPHAVSYLLRNTCEFLGRTFSMMLLEKEKREEAAYHLRIRSVQTKLLEQMSHMENSLQGLIAGETSVMDLFEVGGAALCVDGECYLLGDTPDREDVLTLTSWLSAHAYQDVFYTDALSTINPAAHAYQDRASGLLAITLSKVQQEYLLWFRPEVVQTVTWAGNPAKVAEISEDGLRLSPRKSFQSWVQQVKGTALPWHPVEIRVVTELRNTIIDMILKIAGELKLRADLLMRLNIELEQSNNELDSFAYIASHDLKEPLRGIHNYSRFLLEDYADKLDENGKSKLQTLVRLSTRMDELLDSLLHFSRVGRLDLNLKPTNLNLLLEEVLEELHLRMVQTGAKISIQPHFPVVDCDPIRVKEVFVNLLTNALKYNDKPNKWIEIGWIKTENMHVSPATHAPYTFFVRDNGIGIAAKHFENVFKIFKRLHTQDKFGGGTGAGLTIVRKIIERHSGKIWLESAPGEGTTFYFTLTST
ncbi:GAF domain-containing protein [Rhodocytophaga rosea]|uniref:histidine kinase n=1 Tax=Rhodocytophaga rosea TaxID=2704465 RepID=A0A6C0GM64_9BACT|nr:ATP-binding protein [Rhodocytophaga rosea]QHT69128.1 GAF domain-containing protein [Rhodocytophaga rosea]